MALSGFVSQNEESKTSHCKGRSRGVLEPTCQVGRALGVGTGTLPRLVFCCKVFQVFSAEPPSSGKATSQNVVSMCAHTSDTHLWFPRAPTLQVIVSVPPERAWRKVCFKSAFCPRKLTFIRLLEKHKTVCPSTIMSTKSIAIATTFEGTS